MDGNAALLEMIINAVINFLHRLPHLVRTAWP